MTEGIRKEKSLRGKNPKQTQRRSGCAWILVGGNDPGATTREKQNSKGTGIPGQKGGQGKSKNQREGRAKT